MPEPLRSQTPSNTDVTPDALPDWLPSATSAYIRHVYRGTSIREIARRRGCHASTVLRQVRKVEASRDDPLKDEGLERLSKRLDSTLSDSPTQMETDMAQANAKRAPSHDDDAMEREARRILRRLCESRAFLLVSPDLDKAAVFREAVPGRKTRTAVVDREFAQAFALKDWIEGRLTGKVGKYEITNAGRAALKRMLDQDRKARRGNAMGEEPTAFQAQHILPGERVIVDDGTSRKIRCNLAESPLTILSRKKGPDGQAYISAEMLEAGERLREDFELAQMGPRVAQNWDKFLTASSRGQFGSGNHDGGASDARDRVANALAALGPGLADIAFRACCFLEGLETAEKRLGWSARAGKVVLRIALQRLVDHYAESADARLIGKKATEPLPESKFTRI